jgi:hypothetical protein
LMNNELLPRDAKSMDISTRLCGDILWTRED